MRVIKKYSNRRLYDTSTSAYVNLDELAALIRAGERLQVLDARTGDDLTRSILVQVILEAQGALDLLPVGLLHRIIRLSATGPMVGVFSKQLAAGLELLDAQITRMEEQLNWIRPDAPPPASPPPQPSPAAAPPPPEEDEPEGRTPAEPAAAGSGDGAVDELRARLAALEARLKR